MLIRDLTLTDFRVYRGINHFHFTPDKRLGKRRSIILFGGLNGAGKTSILTGVRLALYGRLSLGTAVSQRRYNEFLLDAIHQSRETGQAPDSASVALTFTYAKLGTENQFHVKREWRRKGNGVKESLIIYEDDHPIKGLSYDQAQNFLNELIPIGVSELFFFDGEKISELADDKGGAALEHSIKKLLGLDVVERLSGDLTVLYRNMTRSSTARSIQEEIETEKSNLDDYRKRVESIRQDITTALAQRSEIQWKVNTLQKSIDDRGGHFSTSRKTLETTLSGLQQQRDQLVSSISLLIGESTPLALADIFCLRTQAQIENDLNAHNVRQEQRILEKYLNKISTNLRKKIPEKSFLTVKKELESLSSSIHRESDAPIHDFTPSQAGHLFSTFTEARKQKAQVAVFFGELEKVESSIEDIGASLARAPDDSLIANDFENLQKLQQKIGSHDAKLNNLRQEGKLAANRALDVARKLDRLYEEAAKNSDHQRVLGYINNANGLLTDFVDLTAASKIRDLESQFTQCFGKLARKDDLQLRINIDPKTFRVDLLAQNGRAIAKDELSAGEKQIFAIAMLEALAKTSGRQLPMIVDTPLGRLDSAHRRKLIEDYFPTASHQMIVLSTDTEVDESFYSDLAPDIARAYKLEYDSRAGATHVREGYFWQTKKAG
ncbi:MAG: DNA sulfur modification protein DndD [Haliea sp.]|mgnify:CR=1 FL=1|nr:DNA sulfur modification protein DndD [Haliea sp.]|tara:strand:- start:13847 stop:15838 length:1992 start_codon:yes stop_codon:yes gene_type:complete